MTGRFCSHRGASMLVLLCCTLVMIQRIDGHPRSRPNHLSYRSENESPLAVASSGNVHPLPSVAEDAEITAGMKPIESSEPSSTAYRRGPRVSRVIEISREERAGGFIDTGKDDEDEDLDDTEFNDDDESNNGNGMDNIQPDVNRYDDTGDGNVENIDDDIKRLLHEAMEERIFLTPEEWQSRTAGTPNQTEINSDTNDSRMVFPEPWRRTTTYLDTVANMPVPTCRDTTYCADVPYYPSDELIESALRMNHIEPISDPSTISQRMGPPDATHDEVPEQSLCESRPKELEPVSGEDDQQEWHYVLNNKKYVQKVNVELCQNAGGSCRILDPLAQGYTTFCKQTHFYRHLVVISKNGTAQTKPIKLPSSCCCHVKFNADPLSRMGVRPRNKQPPQQTPVPAGRSD